MQTRPPKFWARHTAAVPKGFLRYYVLRLLSEKPMSGSEIMEEIEKQTEGHWKPSPGSIYPLLTWLQDRECVEEVPKQEVGIKRYTLTKQGEAFLGEHSQRGKGSHDTFRFFEPPMWFHFYPEKAQELREATRMLALSVWSFRDRLQKEYSETSVKRATKALEEAARNIDEITNAMKEGES